MENTSTYTFKKPTAQQVAWIFFHLNEHFHKGGTFRYLIYDRLGYSPKDYQFLYENYGMVLSMIAEEYLEYVNMEEELKKFYYKENGILQDDLRRILDSTENA